MDINMVAMSVIMNSCNGRDKVDESFTAMTAHDFAKAEKLLIEADAEILKAHKAQTEVIQAQAGGENTEYSLLFVHAQDTLMTSDAQLRIARNMLPVFQAMQKEIEMTKGA